MMLIGRPGLNFAASRGGCQPSTNSNAMAKIVAKEVNNVDSDLQVLHVSKGSVRAIPFALGEIKDEACSLRCRCTLRFCST